jgi:hypothetical protein
MRKWLFSVPQYVFVTGGKWNIKNREKMALFRPLQAGSENVVHGVSIASTSQVCGSMFLLLIAVDWSGLPWHNIHIRFHQNQTII